MHIHLYTYTPIYIYINIMILRSIVYSYVNIRMPAFDVKDVKLITSKQTNITNYFT